MDRPGYEDGRRRRCVCGVYGMCQCNCSGCVIYMGEFLGPAWVALLQRELDGGLDLNVRAQSRPACHPLPKFSTPGDSADAQLLQLRGRRQHLQAALLQSIRRHLQNLQALQPGAWLQPYGGLQEVSKTSRLTSTPTTPSRSNQL